ncbi:MAG: hypothetical protein QOH84_6263 [Kribbellaceae bacterium]|nr:hypothetical protein [Kribbellaceae bacterium]
MDEKAVRDIVQQAARAPSVHNTQPWRFVARDNAIELWTDPSRGLAVLDPAGRARHISCGAAMLHLRVASANAGYASTVTLLPDHAHPDHLGDVYLDPASEPAEADRGLAAAIEARHTVREAFAVAALPAAVVTELRHAAEVEGCWLRIVDGADESIAVAALLARADEMERADPAYIAELRRWTDRAADSNEGVPASAIPDVAPAERGSIYRLRDFVADRESSSTRAAEPPPVERPLVVVLGTRDDDVASWLAAGQGLGRLLLTAQRDGVAASPMTQPLEVPGTRARLATELGVVGHPQMIIRLGYAGENAGGGAATAKPRRPVEQIITPQVPPD